MSWGSKAWGDSYYGGIGGDFRVLSAEALNTTTVRVTFNGPIKTADAATINPSNYGIPGLTVVSVTVESSNSVRLVTSAQAFVIYTVTVSNVLDVASASLNPLYRTATFSGYSVLPQLLAQPQSRIKIQVLFSEDMLNDAALVNPANFDVQDFDGNVIVVNTIDPNGISTIGRVTLHLASELVPTKPYRLKVDPAVKSLGGLSINPSTVKFTWVEYPLTRAVPISAFTEEVRGGLFGTPDGLVFFSPSLADAGVPNSTLQVDSVSVCTKAFDEYKFPVALDPKPFFTFGAVGESGQLNNVGFVFWANGYVLAEAKHVLRDLRPDAFGAFVDGKCTAVLTETFDPSKVSLLNSPYWKTFDGVSVVASTFKTADTSAPISPGTTTTIVIVA